MSVLTKQTREYANHFHKIHYINHHCDPKDCSEIIPNYQFNELSFSTLLIHQILSFLQVNNQLLDLPKSMFASIPTIPNTRILNTGNSSQS